MSQLELSEETMIFYKAIRGVTISMVLLGHLPSGLCAD